MNKKQKLKNAVILGLLMSSVTASSAWAWVPVQAPGWTENRDSNSAESIENHLDYNTQKGELEFGIWAHSNKVVLDYIGVANVNADSLTIDVYNNFFANNKDGNWAVGILAGEKKYDVADGNLSSWVNVNTKNGLVVNVKTRNAEDGYGVFANKLGHIDINNSNGDVYINVQKSLGYGTPGISDENVRYDLSNVYAIKAISDGNVKINSENGNVFVSAFYNKDDAELNNKLKEGNIYGVSNIGGTVDLHAGNVISITANSANGDAYGIYTNSDNFTTLNSEYNQITAVADGNGTAIGIKAENGSKVDIIGNTFVHGDNGALVIQGNNGKDISEQVTVDGNLFASADSGAAITLTDTNVKVTGDEVLIGTGLVSVNSKKNIEGDLRTNGTVTGIAVDLIDSTLSVGQDVSVHSEDSVGINVKNSDFTANGNVSISGEDTALKIENYSLNNVELGNLNSINFIVADNKALDLSGKLTISGTTFFESTSEKSTAVDVKENSTFTSNGSVTALGGQYGFKVASDGANVTINAGENGINLIKANEYRKDFVNENEGFSNAVNVSGDNTEFSIAGDGNILQAGKISEGGYGNETAISAVGQNRNVNIEAGDFGNYIGGAVYANGDSVKVDISSNGGDNVILSSTHGKNNENVHLVSAVFADAGADVRLKAETGGTNYIQTSFEGMSDTANHKDSERTLWAYDGGNISLDGRTVIIASNSGKYTDGKKGNALGIAVAAGGRDLPKDGNDEPFIDTVDNWSNVNIDYDSSNTKQSYIEGDVVAGYGGEINIGQNLIEFYNKDIISTGGNNSLYLKGNLLSANTGELNVDFGKGGTWIGRADDYGDAGTIENYEEHQNFYNPAFSNDIIAGGAVNVKMGEGSTWVLTGQSWITSLEADKSIIDMAGVNAGNVGAFDEEHTHALTIGTFKGEGSTFIMDLDAQDLGQSDMLYIKNNQGTFNVQLKDALTDEELNSLGENGLRFATISGNVDENTKVVYAGSGFSNVVYDVKSVNYDSDDENNSIYNDGYEEDITQKAKVEVEDEEKDNNFNHGKPGQDYVDKNFNEEDKNLIITGIVGRQTGDIGQTIVDMSKANYTNAIYMDRLNKRMGETRFIDGDEGMWVRLRHDRIGKEDSFRSMNTMYEMGYDVKQEKDNGEHRVGVAIDYMDGSTSYSKLSGDGEISRKGIWMYDTWVGEKGHYRDIVAKWGHLSNDFDVYALNGKNVTGDYSNNVYSISAEFGKKNDIGNNWYFEPQAQLQYAHVTGAEYMTNVGTAVNVDDINSLIARAGFRIGKDLGERSTVYFKADLMHEFLGEQDVFAMDNSTGTDGSHVNYDHGGTWCDLGFGFAAAMSKTSYAYLDIETSLGNDYDETYQINAGLQWTF